MSNTKHYFLIKLLFPRVYPCEPFDLPLHESSPNTTSSLGLTFRDPCICHNQPLCSCPETQDPLATSNLSTQPDPISFSGFQTGESSTHPHQHLYLTQHSQCGSQPTSCTPNKSFVSTQIISPRSYLTCWLSLLA